MTISVLFPVHDCDQAQSALTLLAFRSLATALTGSLGEVIVVDDGSSCRHALETMAAEEAVAVQFHQHTERLGLVAALNTAARASRGDILTYCHSDCVVAPDALRRVANVLSQYPEAGMTVSELYFTDGRLQQTGGWIGPAFRLCWSQRVDVVPGPIHWGDFWSVRREFFLLDRGLPEEYNPGYWECVELAARVHDQDWRVLTCPGSRVTHYKSRTFHACFDQDERDRLFERNRRIFAQRWAHRHDAFVATVPRPLDAYEWR
jgi:GT2 family glycosyltransferase